MCIRDSRKGGDSRSHADGGQHSQGIEAVGGGDGGYRLHTQGIHDALENDGSKGHDAGLDDAGDVYKRQVEGFAKKTGNPRFAYDSYRRFIQMYSDVVMEVPKSYFEKIIDEMKEAKGVHFDTELTADDLKELAQKFKAVYKEAMNGEEFPQEPKEQLMGAVKAVFRSWDNPRAIVYRRMNDIPGDWGTAVNVQTCLLYTSRPVFSGFHRRGAVHHGDGRQNTQI